MYLDLGIEIVKCIILIIYSFFSLIFKQIVPYKYRSKSVNNEITLVTGAGSGIGKLVAMKLAKLGAKLVLVDIDSVSNEKTANEIMANGGFARTFTCDLSDQAKIYAVADEIKRTVGNVQILINNAGIVTGKKFLESSDSAIERTFKVNTLAHFWLGKAFLPSIIEKNHGHVVTIASMAGFFGNAGLCDYCASKFAAVGFDESLRNELVRLGKNGVNTTVVCPYYINTGMFDGVKTSVIPLLEPEYVADKIVEAILTNQKILMLPKLMYFMYALKGLLSPEVSNCLGNGVFKTANDMDGFVGRTKSS